MFLSNLFLFSFVFVRYQQPTIEIPEPSISTFAYRACQNVARDGSLWTKRGGNKVSHHLTIEYTNLLFQQGWRDSFWSIDPISRFRFEILVPFTENLDDREWGNANIRLRCNAVNLCKNLIYRVVGTDYLTYLTVFLSAPGPAISALFCENLPSHSKRFDVTRNYNETCKIPWCVKRKWRKNYY